MKHLDAIGGHGGKASVETVHQEVPTATPSIHLPRPPRPSNVRAELADRRAKVEQLIAETGRLWHALRESVKLQSHYAELLNMHDGGKRIVFKSAEEWIERLKP